jgi:hypothetical protein
LAEMAQPNTEAVLVSALKASILKERESGMLSLQSSNANVAQMQANQEIHQQTVAPAPRTSRKRKTPPTNPEPNPIQHMIHPIGTMPGTIPPGFQYNTDFSPAGLPPQNPSASQDDAQQHQHSQSPPPNNSQTGRALSSSKRAEQNRKAQRAFRERRDQSVLHLFLLVYV